MKIFIEGKYRNRFPYDIKSQLTSKGHVFTRDASECEVMLGTKLTANMLSEMKTLKAVFAPKTGADKFPLEALDARGIGLVCSHASAPYVAEHAFALTIALMHRVAELHNRLSDGDWCAGASSWDSLRDKAVGIIGFGSVGREYAKLFAPFACRIRVQDRGKALPKGVEKVETVTDVIDKSQIILFALPKTADSISVLTDRDYDAMKGKFIINVGRAETVSEKKLYLLLESGHLAGYASDVWTGAQGREEKKNACKASHYPFERFANVVMSPHCAIHAKGKEDVAISDAALSLLKYCTGESVRYIDLKRGY